MSFSSRQRHLILLKHGRYDKSAVIVKAITYGTTLAKTKLTVWYSKPQVRGCKQTSASLVWNSCPPEDYTYMCPDMKIIPTCAWTWRLYLHVPGHEDYIYMCPDMKIISTCARTWRLYLHVPGHYTYMCPDMKITPTCTWTWRLYLHVPGHEDYIYMYSDMKIIPTCARTWRLHLHVPGHEDYTYMCLDMKIISTCAWTWRLYTYMYLDYSIDKFCNLIG